MVAYLGQSRMVSSYPIESRNDQTLTLIEHYHRLFQGFSVELRYQFLVSFGRILVMKHAQQAHTLTLYQWRIYRKGTAVVLFHRISLVLWKPINTGLLIRSEEHTSELQSR